jgi:hypothetical protein
MLLPPRSVSFELGCIGSSFFRCWSNSFLLFSHLFKNGESPLNLGDEILVRGGVL